MEARCVWFAVGGRAACGGKGPRMSSAGLRSLRTSEVRERWVLGVPPAGLLLCPEVSRAELEQTWREVRSPATFSASIAHPFEGPCMSTCPVPRPARPGHSVAPGPSRCLPVKVDATSQRLASPQRATRKTRSRCHAGSCVPFTSTSLPVVDSAVPPAGEKGSVRSSGNRGHFLVFTSL